MKKIVSVIISLIINCVFTTDQGVVPRTRYYYVNKSSYEVKISILSEKPLNYKIIDSIIPIGDTIRFKNVSSSLSDIYPFGDSVDVKLTFFSNPPKCLIFSGEIIHDSTSNDSIKDIRSYYSYTNHNVFTTDSNGVFGLQKLYYIITDLHYQKSTNCE